MLQEVISDDRIDPVVSPFAGPRLSDALFSATPSRLAQIATLDSNVNAIDSCILFSAGLSAFVGIVGPSGWGKTDILAAVSSIIYHQTGAKIPVRTASEWIESDNRHNTGEPLILDDAQDPFSRLSTRQKMKLAIERRVKNGQPTLVSFTSDRAGRPIRNLLPNAKCWKLAHINEPSAQERRVIIRNMASREQMRIAEPLISLMAEKTRGNGRSLLGALKRLKLLKSDWIDDKSLLRGCGILFPFLSDKNGWDLRDHTYEIVQSVIKSQTIGRDLDRKSMEFSVYIMLHLLAISEKDVESFFELTSIRAYRIANRINASLECPDTSRLVRECVRQLILSL